MVFNDLDYNSGIGNIINENENITDINTTSSLHSAPNVSIEEFSSYFQSTGEIKSLDASIILPERLNSGKKYCTLLDDDQHGTWPNVLKYHCHDVYYNLNSSCEELEACVYKLVKSDTNSLTYKEVANTVTDNKVEDKDMIRNNKKKRNISELLFTSPERKKLFLHSIETNGKKLKEVQRCEISSTSKVKQIFLVSDKKKGQKKVKACFQTSLRLDFNTENHIEHASTQIAETSVPSGGCRKGLFKSQVSLQPFANQSQMNPNMSIDWSIRKNRPTNSKKTKPILSLNPEKYMSPSNENKYNLALRKGLQRTMFLNGTCDTVNNETEVKMEVNCSKKSKSPKSKSLYRFDSMSSEDMQKFGQTERLPGELSDRHRKKLREAVANALENHGITLNHPSFKTFGRNLFAICRSHLKDIVRNRRTSIQMKQLAESHVKQVVEQERTTDVLQ